VTANQTVVTYTVSAGKTYYLQEFDCSANTEAAAATNAAFGTCQLIVGGTTYWQQYLHGAGTSGPWIVQYAEPIPVSAGTVITIAATPSATTAFFWYANLGGYEK
jgi:hypothetical protein